MASAHELALETRLSMECEREVAVHGPTIKKLGTGLVFCGRKALDPDTDGYRLNV